jgi:excisionase family DNA binding protein
MKENRFMDVPAVAEYIHLAKSTVYKMVSNKTIPYSKIGSRTLFDRVQIDQWVINGGVMEDRLPSLPSV